MAKGFSRPAGSNSGMMQQMQMLQEQLAVSQAKLIDEAVTATSDGDASIRVMKRVVA
jgi:DNA-binding protein YbaB